MTPSGVYITGTSMLSSLGIGNSSVWEAAVGNKATQVERCYQMADGSIIQYPVYAMQPLQIQDWTEEGNYSWLSEEQLDNDIDFIYLIAAIKLAISDAGINNDSLKNAALIVGHENLGVNHLIDRIMLSPEDPFMSPMASYDKFRNDFFKLQSFSYLFYLAKVFGIGGASYTVNNACASGLHALELGSKLIQSGLAEVAIVVCSDYAHVTEHLWLGHKGFGSENGILRPFDARRDGSVLGDGSAAVVLESSRSISKRKLNPSWCYKGGSFKQDSWQMALPDVMARSYSYVIQECVRNFAYGSIDLLVPHGAGMKLWDLYEAKEINEAFTQLHLTLPDMTAFKGYLGHTLGANALLEAVLLLHCMKNSLIIPVQNYEQPDAKINLPLTTKVIEKNVRTAIKTVSAYGGFQAAACFEKIV